MRNSKAAIAALITSALIFGFWSCTPSSRSGKKTIVVTYSILGAAVKELVGDTFDVLVSIPDGLDPHSWEPSAKDIESIHHAALVVENGLGFEEGMKKTLAEASKAGVRIFTAADHVLVRTVGRGEGIPSGDPDQAVGAEDPHLWTDPVRVQAVLDDLAEEIQADFKIDLSKRRADFDARLLSLDAEIADSVESIPPAKRVLVTGHESMGYFAERYGFRLVGAVVPSLSSQAEGSAAELSALKALIKKYNVSVIFTELGESPRVAESLAKEAMVKAVPLSTHSLPKGGGYVEFARDLASTIVGALAK